MKKTKTVIAKFSKHIGKLTPRKVIIGLVCVVCLLIPSFLALSIIFADDSSYIPDSLSVELYDAEHVLIAKESAEPNLEKHNSLADIFYHIITESTSIQSPPIPPEESLPLYANVVYNGDRSDYVCYFSFINGSSYYIDEDGSIFLISRTNAENFLSSIYAESLYTKAAPPKLYTNTGLSITPSSASWFYRLYDDTYREALNYKTTTDAVSYEFSEIIDVKFEDEPDDCTARVFENGSLIYEGSREALSKLMIRTSGAIRITLDARWKESEGALFHGEVSYSFDAILRDRSEFSLSNDVLSDGGFIILSCSNIKDISKIVFNSDSEYSPTFSRNGSNVQALIPYPKNTNKTSFDFTVSYGASSKHFSVKLSSASQDESNTHTLSTSSKSISDAMSATARNKLDYIINELSLKASSTVYFQGNLYSPLDSGFAAGYNFGDTVTVPDESISITTFGNEYFSSTDGQSVLAVCSGNVIATGSCDTLGNYIVIDHGLGLMSWYCHLSDFDTSVGKTLAVGDSVGKSGVGGFADTDGFLLLFTLKNELLNPSVILEHK